MEWIYPNEDVTIKQLLHQLYILADTSVNLTTAEKNIVPYETRLDAIAILLLAYHDRKESFSIASTKASKADLKNINAALYRAESKERLLDQLTKDGKLI